MSTTNTDLITTNKSEDSLRRKLKTQFIDQALSLKPIPLSYKFFEKFYSNPKITATDAETFFEKIVFKYQEYLEETFLISRLKLKSGKDKIKIEILEPRKLKITYLFGNINPVTITIGNNCDLEFVIKEIINFNDCVLPKEGLDLSVKSEFILQGFPKTEIDLLRWKTNILINTNLSPNKLNLFLKLFKKGKFNDLSIDESLCLFLDK